MSDASPADIAKHALTLLDLTNLNEECGEEDIRILCRRAVTPYGNVAAVCIWPAFVQQAVDILKGSGIRVATVVNFPQGGEDTFAVVAETQAAIQNGADEIDLVMPYRAFMSGRRGFAEELIIRVKAALPEAAALKVILETGELKDPLLIHMAAQVAIAGGADFIKTSTGKTSGNATLEAAEVMLTVIEETNRETGKVIGFKPSGGIRTTEDATAYLALAHKILGTSWVSQSTFRFGASGLLDALIGTIEGMQAAAGEGY